MAIIKKYSSFENLSNYKTFIIDDEPNSEFFKISEFKETFTGGKNGFLIEGSPYLKETTELKIEVLDTEGNPMYFEPGNGIPEYYEGNSILVAVHVYDDTPIGIGQITILGEIKNYETENGLFNVPSQWKNVYNVKWQKKFKINKLLANEDTVRFYKRPLIGITEIVKPIFSLSIPTVTQTGNLIGIPQTPAAGTSLNDWTIGTTYLLQTNDNTRWTGSVIGSVINIDTPTPYTPTVIEVINSTQIIVDTPYTINNIVKSFSSTPYEVTFEDIDSQLLQESSLTGSFAQIKMSNLKTFVGDVARVKVYRKSRNEVGDYQFIQETKLESTELLRDLTTLTDTQISYGNLTPSNLYKYWVSSSNDHPISINKDILLNSIKIDYDEGIGGIQRLETDTFIDIASDVEYTLSFKTLLSGSVDSSKYIKAHLSSSDYSQDILQINSINDYKQRSNISENIIATTSSLAKLVFDISGSDWFISTISLRNAQETSFSPDEIIVVQDVPRKLAVETFDYRFEFYDINNNYIPVDVLATKEFNGGNLTTTFSDSTAFTFTSSIPYFRFVTGSIGNPVFQSIPLSVYRNFITGSVTYGSSSYDTNGDYIDPSVYTGQYPGKLTNANNIGATLLIGNFTGSDSNYTVGTIEYTASLGPYTRYQRVDRIQEGLSTSELFATSNTNQFYYLASNLSGSPQTQEIRIQVKRKNLSTIIAEITAVSQSGAPPLTAFSDINGTKTYKIAVDSFPYTTGEVTYQFTGSDQFGLLYSDDIVITPIINYSGITVDVTNTGTAFQASSEGLVQTLEYDRGDGEISLLEGGNIVPFSAGLVAVNTFDISLASPSAGLTVNESVPTSNSYGISNMSVDQGQLTLTIRYKDGSGTITTFTKVISYSKIRASKPTAAVSITPQAQVLNASASGELLGDFQDPVLSIIEGSDSFIYNQTPTLSNGEYKITNVTGVSVWSTIPNTSTIDVTGISSETNFGDVSYEYKNTSGALVTGSIIFSIAVAKNGNGATVVLPDGLITGSDQLTGSLDLIYEEIASGTHTLVSGSSQIEYSAINNLSAGIISSSNQLTTFLKNTTDTLTGNLTVTGYTSSSSFIKIGGTNDDILLGDGTTSSLSSLTGSLNTGDYLFAGNVFKATSNLITMTANDGWITAKTINVNNIAGAAVASLKSTNGYQLLGGGTIIQWGRSTLPSNSQLYFPIAFPVSCRYVGVTSNRTAPGSSGYNHANTISTTGFKAIHDGGASGCWWMAIGY